MSIDHKPQAAATAEAPRPPPHACQRHLIEPFREPLPHRGLRALRAGALGQLGVAHPGLEAAATLGGGGHGAVGDVHALVHLRGRERDAHAHTHTATATATHLRARARTHTQTDIDTDTDRQTQTLFVIICKNLSFFVII